MKLRIGPLRIDVRSPRLPKELQRPLDRKAAEQALGSQWGFLADVRDPVLDGNEGKLADVLIGSPLSSTELWVLSTAAAQAAKAKEKP